MPTKKDHKQFLEELSAKSVNVTVLEPYIDSRTPIACKCNICGNTWHINPNNLLRGYGCPVCGLKKRATSRTKDHNSFISELQTISLSVLVQEKYKGARVPLKCKCRDCGHVWNAAPTNLLKERKCPKCASKNRAEKQRRTNDDFLALIHELGHNIEPEEEYKGSMASIRMKCNDCGYRWVTSASSVIAGSGCPRCAGNGIYTQEEYINKLKVVNPHIQVVSDYIRSAKPIKCKCLICGYVWETTPNDLLSKTGCPNCYHSNTSFFEQVILEVFMLVVGENGVVSHDRKSIGKELDIFVPSMHLAIEPGSWRWHKDKITRDRHKREICENAGIRLITVYSDFDGEKPPFEKDCICIKETLGFDGDKQVLKILVDQILQLVGVQIVISELQWDTIEKRAYEHSRRISTTEFKEKLLSMNAKIEIKGEYRGAWNTIPCECKKCGYSWTPVANSLLRGHGCPKCAAIERGEKRRKAPAEFEEELRRVNSNICLLSPYTSSMEKVQCKCLLCGNEWMALPGNLRRGKGCPICAKKKDKLHCHPANKDYKTSVTV